MERKFRLTKQTKLILKMALETVFVCVCVCMCVGVSEHVCKITCISLLILID